MLPCSKPLHVGYKPLTTYDCTGNEKGVVAVEILTTMQVPGLADITINANGYDISCYDKERC